jgi:hypothetical protein
MKHCIVNFSDNKYRLGQERLVSSLIEHRYQGDIVIFSDYDEVGSKPHQEAPYQFKVKAIEKARDMGYDVVLYCDASIYALKDVMPTIFHIIEHGSLMENCGFTVGQFSTDECLKEFGITRDEAMNMQMHSAGFTGLCFRDEKVTQFFDQWLKYANEEKTFKGSWTNHNSECSKDKRCLGHRHDQTVASILAHQLEIKRINPTFMQYIYPNTTLIDSVVFGCQGII